MRIGIGIAQDKDSARAAARAVRQARRGVARPDLSLAFGGVRPPGARPTSVNRLAIDRTRARLPLSMYARRAGPWSAMGRPRG